MDVPFLGEGKELGKAFLFAFPERFEPSKSGSNGLAEVFLTPQNRLEKSRWPKRALTLSTLASYRLISAPR